MAKRGKVTWIIGDIHGMYDPLRLLIDHLNNEWVDKFIFLGDYIDYGPSSKEVVDFIMALGDKAITLMGNHEHLLLDSLLNEAHRTRYGKTVWENNGATRTYSSFRCKSFEEFEAKIEPKYIDFFKNLKCFHKTKITCQNAKLDILATHAGIMPTIPLEEQLNINSYDAFNKYMNENKIWIEDTFIWVRDAFFKCNPDLWTGHLIIHGHTPTHLLDHYVKSVASSSVGDSPYVRKHPKTGRAVSIDIDTGAAFGHKLTAIGLSMDEVRCSNTPRLTLHVVQLAMQKGYYRIRPIEFDTITVDFGDL